MSQSSNQQVQSRRKNRRTTSASILPSLTTVVATAAVAVGTYQLAKWAWGVYEESNRKQKLAAQEPQSMMCCAVAEAHDEVDDSGGEEHVDEEEIVTVEEEDVIEELILEDLGDAASSQQGHVRFRLPERGMGSDRSDAPTDNGASKASASRTGTPAASKVSAPAGDGASASAPARTSHTSSKLTPAQWRIRRHRLARCRDETAAALTGFLASVRRIVEERTDTLAETRELKRLRAHRGGAGIGAGEGVSRLLHTSLSRERELWERIKIRSVTRMVASAYANTVLFLVLTVQVNLLGGRLFEEQIFGRHEDAPEPQDAADAAAVDRDRTASYQASHRFVLTHTYEHFFAKGLASLVNAVEKAATAALADWNVLDPSSLRFTLEEFDEGIRKVRVLVGEGSSVSGSSTPTLLRFLQPPPAEGSSTPPKINDELARSILDETWDLLESPVLEDALDSCLATTFGMMRDLHWGTVFEDERPSPSGMAGSKAHPTYGTRPLATVLTKLKKTASSFYDGGRALAAESEGMTKAGGKQGERETPGPAAAFPSSYFAALEQLPAVLELADVSFS